MAYRDVQDWHSRTAPRPYPPSPLPVAEHDWRSGPETVFHSLPYRRPKDLIQGPDEITSSHGRSRTSRASSGASATVVETMPGMPKTPATAAFNYRRGRYPVPEFDDYTSSPEEELPEPLAGRRRSPVRGRSPRAAHPSRPSRRLHESRRSSASSRSRTETETDDESATSVSTQEERRQRRRDRPRREKDRYEKPTRRPAVEEQRRRPAEEKKPKRRRKIREVVYVAEDDDSTEPTRGMSPDGRSTSPPRRRSRLSRSASERHYSRQHSHSPVRMSSHHRPSPKAYEVVSKPSTFSKGLAYGDLPARGESQLVRVRHARRHPTEVVYAGDSRSVRRSNTASGASHVTSHSTASSNKRPSSFLGQLLPRSARSHSPEKPVKLVTCVACMDEFRSTQVAKLKCRHYWCDSCLKGRFKLSVSDPQSMPPKCCSSDLIPLKHVERLLSDDFKMKWNRKYYEVSTRNRIYCPSRRCDEWIRPADIYRREGRKCGKCSRCKTEVCCACKGRWHSSRECPDDEDTTRFLEQAKEAGWQRCYKCNHVVELEEGCNHMTCRCGAQFCMICGVKWKNCECPWFNYETAAADQLHNMQVPVAVQRLDRLDPTRTPRSMRPTVGSGPPPRSRSQDYDDRLVRRFQENREEDPTRRLSIYEDHPYDRGYEDTPGIENTARVFMNDEYRRDENVFVSGPPVPPAPTPPAAFERPAPTDYMSGVNRARGLPPDTMGQRLADRFSEFRSSPGGPRTGMMAAPSSHAAPPMGPPHPMTAPMGMGHPPPIPMLRRHTMEEELYNTSRTMRSSERVVPGRMVHDYEMEAAVHAPRSRRRLYAEPKSSTLAGLTGPGRGMNRVFEWRNHVHPGAPEGDGVRA